MTAREDIEFVRREIDDVRREARSAHSTAIVALVVVGIETAMRIVVFVIQ